MDAFERYMLADIRRRSRTLSRRIFLTVLLTLLIVGALWFGWHVGNLLDGVEGHGAISTQALEAKE